MSPGPELELELELVLATEWASLTGLALEMAWVWETEWVLEWASALRKPLENS